MSIVMIDRMAWVKVPTVKDALKLKQKYTLETKDFDGNPKIIKAYEETEEPCVIGIPRGIFNNTVSPRNWTPTKLVFKGKLRKNQDILISSFKHYLKSHPNGGILQAPTGVGKTVMGLKLAEIIGGPVLVVVPLTKLLSQWKGEIRKFTDQEDIGLIQGKTCDYKDKVFTVAMLHSLAQKTYPKEMYSYFKLVIFDEVHTIGAETFSEVAKQFYCQCRIGLSATPFRQDGMDKVARLHIGAVVSERKFGLDLIPKIYVIQTNYFLLPLNSIRSNTVRHGMAITNLATNQLRNKLLLNIIVKLYKQKRTILVLSDRISQLDSFYRKMKKRFVSRFYGSYREPVNKVNLATYGSAGTGLNIPQLDALVLATPRGNIEQAVGRILRKYEGKKDPIVVDLQDRTYSSRFNSMFRSRLNFYNSIKSKIIYIKEDLIWKSK